MIQRRHFIASAALGLSMPVAWPQQLPRRVGILTGIPESELGRAMVGGFRDGMRALGWAEDRRLLVKVWWGEADPSLMQANAEQAVRERFDVYAVQGASALRRLLSNTPQNPVVFWGVSDPVGNGLVKSLAKPGGNVTGFALYPFDIAGKWLELLKEAIPSLTNGVVLMGADNVNLPSWRDSLGAAAQSLGITLTWPRLRNTPDMEAALSNAAGRANTGVLVLSPTEK